MRKRYWAGAALAVVVGITALSIVRSGPPSFIWTDGVRICDAPGGSRVECVPAGPFGSLMQKAHEEAERIYAITNDPTVQGTRHRPVFLAFESSRIECLAESVRSRMWINGFSIIRTYSPAADGTDERDAGGTAWWRCDLVR